MRTSLILLSSLVLLPCQPTSAHADPAPLDAVCAEPAGQADTPPHPRLDRFAVGGVDVAVVLPPGYDRGKRRYPVLYLLHGPRATRTAGSSTAV